MEQLRGKVRDRKVLRLIRCYLEAGVELPNGAREATLCGVPQGGPLSPLLANIVLDPLDKELEKRGHHFARYADDFLIMVRSAKAAKRVKESVTRFVEGTLKLEINQDKSRSAPLRQCSFLGFQIGSRGKLVWTAKVQERFKRRVREITSRSRGVRVQDVIVELRRYVIGWLGYFGISHTYRVLLELEEWVRRRVRLYYWKQWKRPGTRRRHLMALGVAVDKTQMATGSRKGYWRISFSRVVHYGLTNAWLKEQGVPDMRAKWIAIHYPDSSQVV